MYVKQVFNKRTSSPPWVGKANNLANVPIPICIPMKCKCKCKCKSSKYSTSARPHPLAWAKPIIWPMFTLILFE